MSIDTRLRPWFIGAGVGLLLACGGLDFDAPDLEDVSRARASSAGYSVPEGAEHIYAYNHSDPDRRSTYLRFALPSEAFDHTIAEYRSSAVHTERPTWTIPESWPDFGPYIAPDSWWQPTGAVVFQTSQSSEHESGGSTMGSGGLAAFDEPTHTVFIWLWQWERWTLRTAAGEPLVVHVSEVSEAPSVELGCESGYRQRRHVEKGSAVFADAPMEEGCQIRLRGGVPLHAALPPGAREVSCHADGDRMVCTPD